MVCLHQADGRHPAAHAVHPSHRERYLRCHTTRRRAARDALMYRHRIQGGSPKCVDTGPLRWSQLSRVLVAPAYKADGKGWSIARRTWLRATPLSSRSHTHRKHAINHSPYTQVPPSCDVSHIGLVFLALSFHRGEMGVQSSL